MRHNCCPTGFLETSVPELLCIEEECLANGQRKSVCGTATTVSTVVDMHNMESGQAEEARTLTTLSSHVTAAYIMTPTHPTQPHYNTIYHTCTPVTHQL